jgi:hypothetical protein
MTTTPNLKRYTSSMLVCSTAHLAEGTADRLTYYTVGREEPMHSLSFYNIEGGWLVWTGTEGLEDPQDEDLAGVPAELRALLIHAKQAGIEWVHFDCDAPAIDGIPTFTW